MSEPFPPRALQRLHAQTIRDSSHNYKIDYVIVIKTFLNPKGNQNRISGSIVMAISLQWRILPIGGASAVEGLQSTGLPRLVSLAIKWLKLHCKIFPLLTRHVSVSDNSLHLIF